MSSVIGNFSHLLCRMVYGRVRSINWYWKFDNAGPVIQGSCDI